MKGYLSLGSGVMKCLALLVPLAALAACGGAPEPLPYPDVEALDRRFMPPARSEATSLVDMILKKEELSLDEVLAIAEAMNPELGAARKEIDLATAAVWEARLYPNPSLLFEFEDYRTKDKATIGKMERSAGISFPLVVSGRIGAASSLAEKEREVAAVNYLWRRREILSGVKRSFFGLLGARRQADLVKSTRDLAKSLHDVANERFRAQAVAEIEVLKSAVALAKAESDLRLADRATAVALKVLHASMGNVDLPKDKLSGDLATLFTAPSLEALRGHVTTLHPLLEVSRKAKEAAELNLSLARAERLPDLGLEITAGRGPDDDSIVEGGISIPLPLFNRNQAKIASAQARIDQAEFHVLSVRNDLLLRLTEAYHNFVGSQERVTSYQEEVLPKAEKALDQSNEGYRLGKFSQLDVLDAQRTLAEARTAYAVALTELNLAATDLEKLTGLRLERAR